MRFRIKSNKRLCTPRSQEGNCRNTQTGPPAKITSNPQIMQVKRSYLEYSQLNSASALKIVYDKGMVENHCGKDKRQVLRESEIYSRENQNHNNNSFTCGHCGNQDISKIKVPPKQQEPKVHPRQQNRRNEFNQLSLKIKPPTKKIDKKLNQLQN